MEMNGCCGALTWLACILPDENWREAAPMNRASSPPFRARRVGEEMLRFKVPMRDSEIVEPP